MTKATLLVLASCLVATALFSATAAAPCNSANVRFAMLSTSGTCGYPFQALLYSVAPDASCPLSTGGVLTCDSNLRNCINCTDIASTAAGILVTCNPTNSNGFQVLTATYALGPLLGTIANGTVVTGCNPVPSVPVQPPPILHPPSEPCDSATMSFTMISGPRTCGSSFQALLSTSDPKAVCPLSSGGLLACDSNRRNCRSCGQPAVTSDGLLFTCLPTNYNGVQQITATYQLGNFIGTIATSDTFAGCSPV